MEPNQSKSAGNAASRGVEKRRTKEPLEPHIALRIRTTAERCNSGPGKARFRCGSRQLIAEDLILLRWRRRRSDRERFHGCRLPPHTWDVAKACIANGFRVCPASTDGELERAIEIVRRKHPRWKAPNARHFLPLLKYLASRRVLHRVLERARSAASPGLPDLVLYRTTANGEPRKFIFAEVKRVAHGWRERLLPAQSAELAFLKECRLTVCVVRLLER